MEEKIKFLNLNYNTDVLFNLYLFQNQDLIRKIIKKMDHSYKIIDRYFEVINPYIDLDGDNLIYPGLIVRTDVNKYAILFLNEVDDDAILSIVNTYIKEKDLFKCEEVNVYKFKVNKNLLV